jgi:hypothetical protein
VTVDDLVELTAELLGPERLSAAGIGTDADVFRRGIEPVIPALAAVPAES